MITERSVLGRWLKWCSDWLKTRKRGSPVVARSDEERHAMNTAYEQLIRHLDERDIRYLTNTDNHSVCADFREEVGVYRIVATVNPEEGLFQVFGHSPVRVPVGSRPAIAETITRANYGLKVGKFEMDFEDGDLRFQASQVLPDDSLDDETIRRLIGAAIVMLNTYLPAVLSVIYGNELPKDAIGCVEKPLIRADETEPDEQEDDA